MTSGSFITIDGVDGAGKSTQIQRLADHVRELGRDVVCVRDPGSTNVGTQLRELLLDSDLVMHRRTEAMLFMASRCEMIETIIRPALNDGRVVISDRFLLSTVVYQSIGSADGASPGVDAAKLWQLGRMACDGLDPDLTIVLDMPAETSMSRWTGQADRMESRGIDYMRRVREAYLREVPHCGGQSAVIDADEAIDIVTERVIAAIASSEIFSSS